MTTTFTRAGAALAAAGLLLGMLSACTPEPGPDPTKSPKPTKTAIFESDEEAFAAAEKTYREYNDATNAEQQGDKNADSNKYLVGSALEETIQARRDIEELGYRLDGDITIQQVIPNLGSIRADRTQLELLACLDLTTSRVLLESGEEADIPNRPDVIASRSQMTWVDDRYLISEQGEGDVEQCD